MFLFQTSVQRTCSGIVKIEAYVLSGRGNDMLVTVMIVVYS